MYKQNVMILKLKSLSYLFVFSFILILSGCEKEFNDSDTQLSDSDNLSTAIIPSDFDWSSTKQISINIKVNSLNTEKSDYSVEIFDKNPSDSDAKSLYNIDASLDKDYTTVMTISKAVTSVYIQKTYPSGQTSITSEKIDEDILTVDFTDMVSVKSSSLLRTKGDEDSYPITETDGGTYTYLFEDCWPKMGDYDMNDLVMDIQGITYGMSTDDDGGITGVNSIDYTVAIRAAGGAYKLGAGIQFDEITPIAVFYASINKYSKHSDIKPSFLTGEIFTNSSKQVEEGQTKVVIPICDEVHQALETSKTMTNTKLEGNTADTLQIKFHIGFNANRLPLRENVGIENFNVFIVVNDGIDYGNNTNGDKKRKEIHMAGYALTDLGTNSLFGTESDNSTEHLFKSKDGLMWGMVVPGHIGYPKEYQIITKAYPKFKSWAISGGTTNTDWYENPASGYIYGN